ncbi:MAG: LytTR family DNA-binding domain-containing protein [Bacteroidota bacterium]
MGYNVLVVDDEREALNRLLLHLEKFSPKITITTCSNGKEALASIAAKEPDVVFMDIEMPELNGIEVVRRCTPPYPYFIFVTAYNSYAIEAFEQNAIDYVLKPYSPERISTALNKAFGLLEKDQLAETASRYQQLLQAFTMEAVHPPERKYIRRIAVKSIGKTAFINVDDIELIEGADQYVEVVTAKKRFTVRESMDRLEKTLDPQYFFRTHRSFIVNINLVAAVENIDKHSSLVLLKNGKKLKLANSRKSDFQNWMYGDFSTKRHKPDTN